MCLCGFMLESGGAHGGREGVRHPRAGFACGCEPPVLNDTNQTQSSIKAVCVLKMSYLSFYFFTF